MIPLVAAFSLLVAASGWFYVFYSKSASRLSAVEAPADNLRRVICRRINGVAMLLLGAFFYIGAITLNPDVHPRLFLLTWLAVLLLLGLIMILVFVDLRLTMKIRRGRSR
jgi:drug/metabolite transporter (DMT)-like permease